MAGNIPRPCGFTAPGRIRSEAVALRLSLSTLPTFTPGFVSALRFSLSLFYRTYPYAARPDRIPGLALERAGTPIGPLDTLIAAHALSLGLTLVTNNVREFRRVAALPIEDWLAP